MPAMPDETKPSFTKDGSFALGATEFEKKRKGEVMTREWFFECLRADEREESGIFMLPLVLLLLVLFTGMVLGHERSVARQSLRSAIRDDIVENANYDYLNQTVGFKNLDNVNAPAAIVDWMRLGFFDHLLWKTADDNGVLTGRYLQHNRIIGGVRLLTQRMEESVGKCEVDLAEMLGTPCMHKTTNDRAAEGYDDLAFAPDGEETTDWSAGPNFEPYAIRPHNVEWFMMSENRHVQEVRLGSLIDADFLDRQTRQVMVSMVLFNADLQLISLVESNFLFSRTGRVWPLLRIKTIDPDPFHQPHLFPFDVLFIAIMFMNFVRDFHAFFSTWHKVGFSHLRRNLPHGLLWYFLDVVGLTCSCVLFFAFWTFYQSATSLVEELEFNYTSMISDQSTMDHFLHNVEETAHTTLKPYRTTLLVYPINLMLRLGLGFSGNARLSMTTRVITSCASDLFHFMLVYMSFLFCFTILAMLMFGRDVEGFSTMSRSLQSNIQMMFGDVDWEVMNAAGFVRALMFYWAFHVTLALIMFNIIVAIIIDAYESLREEMGKHVRPQTLYAQTVQTVKRRRRVWKGETIKLKNIWMACLRKYGHEVLSDAPFTEEELMEAVPRLPAEQAKELFEDALMKLRLSRRREMSEDGEDPDAMEVSKVEKIWRHAERHLEARTAGQIDTATGPSGLVKMGAVLVNGVRIDTAREGVPTRVGLPADVVLVDDAPDDRPVQLGKLSDVLSLAIRMASRRPKAKGEKVYSRHTVQALQLSLALQVQASAEEEELRGVTVSEDATVLHAPSARDVTVCCSPWA